LCAQRPPEPAVLGSEITETLTFLFTDIEGSTQKVARLGDTYPAVLTEHHQIIREALAAHEGREVSTAGDGFFAVFSSPRAREASDEIDVGLTGLDGAVAEAGATSS